MIYYLLLTAFTVSIDSFLCGFSLSFCKGKKIFIPAIITLTVFEMCLIANYSIRLFDEQLSEKSASLGGFLLIIVGLLNLVRKDESKSNYQGEIIKQSFLSGFAVGLDGSMANFSLALMGLNQFYVPLTIAIMHGILISLGIALRNSRVGSLFERYNFIPPLILIALGVIKLSPLFI